jgi:YbbR domain-containing protein
MVSAFWGIYSGKQLSLINITTSVDFRNIPETIELRRSSSETVEVQITGKRRLVSALNPEQVEAFLDLSEIDSGLHRFVLSAENIELPLGMEVVRITPAAIRVEMEERIQKDIAVEPQIVGKPPAGYKIERISVRPGSVKVSGPKSTLDSMLSLSTESISVTDIQPQEGAKVLEVPVVLSPASLRLVPGQSKNVRVTILLIPNKSSKNSPATTFP